MMGWNGILVGFLQGVISLEFYSCLVLLKWVRTSGWFFQKHWCVFNGDEWKIDQFQNLKYSWNRRVEETLKLLGGKYTEEIDISYYESLSLWSKARFRWKVPAYFNIEKAGTLSIHWRRHAGQQKSVRGRVVPPCFVRKMIPAILHISSTSRPFKARSLPSSSVPLKPPSKDPNGTRLICKAPFGDRDEFGV